MRTAFLLSLIALCLFPFAARAGEVCTLVVEYPSMMPVHETGNCAQRHAPQSTFKIPLALMGFDSGILKDEKDPLWEFQEGYLLNLPSDKAATDPTRWEKDSVVWFSQKLTSTLGQEKFSGYIKKFSYGNQDISGDHGKNNGLTRSWLSSSLQISPREQISFLRKLIAQDLGVSEHATLKTMKIIPSFSAGSWTVKGKTGTGYVRDASGELDKSRQEGWFIGWAERDGSRILFTTFIRDDEKMESYAGPRARDALLSALPGIMERHDRARH